MHHYHMAPIIGRDPRTHAPLRDVLGAETPPYTSRQCAEFEIRHPSVNGGYMMFRCHYGRKLCRELHGDRQTLA